MESWRTMTATIIFGGFGIAVKMASDTAGKTSSVAKFRDRWNRLSTYFHTTRRRPWPKLIFLGATRKEGSDRWLSFHARHFLPSPLARIFVADTSPNCDSIFKRWARRKWRFHRAPMRGAGGRRRDLIVLCGPAPCERPACHLQGRRRCLARGDPSLRASTLLVSLQLIWPPHLNSSWVRMHQFSKIRLVRTTSACYSAPVRIVRQNFKQTMCSRMWWAIWRMALDWMWWARSWARWSAGWRTSWKGTRSASHMDVRIGSLSCVGRSVGHVVEQGVERGATRSRSFGRRSRRP